MHRRLAAAALGLLGTLLAIAPAAAAPSSASGAIVTVSTDCNVFCFAPAGITVVAGTTVTWIDKSGTPHNITRCRAANCNGRSGGTGTDPAFTAATLALPARGRAHYTFTQPGSYVYFCSIHGYGLMHGTITVTAAEAVTTTPSPAAPVAVAPVAVAPATTAAVPLLASTGPDTSVPLAVAVILVVGGGSAIAFSARRRAGRLAGRDG